MSITRIDGRPARRVAIGAACALVLLAATSAAGGAPETGPSARKADWPAGTRFRTHVQANRNAEAYDVTVVHDGLAQPDARDVRVLDPSGGPVSHFIAYADRNCFRVVFDGAAGPGRYRVYFGNLSPDMRATPAGVSAFGRAGWVPKGGYTCVSYAPTGRRFGWQDMRNLQATKDAYEAIRANAEAATAEEVKKQAAPKRRRTFIHRTMHRGTDTRLPDRCYHVFRAGIRIPAAGTYEFMIGHGRASGNLGVLFLDGDYRRPLVPGWHTRGSLVYDANGSATLAAGTHRLEFYTNRRNPEIRLRLAGSGEVMRYLGGLDAHYEHAAELAPGDMEAASGDLGTAYLAAVRRWLALGRYDIARSLSRVGCERFPARKDLVAQLAAAYERAGQAAYENNWLTEGKYADRRGAVPEAAFGPPFRLARALGAAPQHDRYHVSGSAWVRGKLIYGLPFDVQETPWAVTSAICVADDVLYVGTKNGLMLAVQLSTGKKKWTFPGGGACLGCPLIYRGRLYYGAVDRRLYALDARRGRMVWNFPAKGWIEGGPCAADGRIFFGSRDGQLYAIDAALGIQRWRAPLGGEIVAAPSTAGGRVFVGTLAGDFFAVDARTGRTLWKYAARAPVRGGCCISAGRVYFGDRAGKVHCLNTADGKPVWQAPVDVGGPVIASPILVGSVLYGGTEDGKLWGIDVEAGRLGWQGKMPRDGAVARPPLFADGSLVFTSRNAESYFDPATGRQVLRYGQTAVYQMAAPAQPLPCLRSAGAIAIDGKLDEPAWKQAERLPAFFKHNGMLLGDPVEAKLLWDDKRLYVGAACKDADLVASPASRDADRRVGDAITILLDPRGDGLAVCELAVTPRGGKVDTLLTAVGGDPGDAKTKATLSALKLAATGAAWNPEWSAAVAPAGTLRAPEAGAGDVDTGWTVEIAIPFASLPKSLARPPRGGTRWRINVVVSDRSGSRAATWCLSPTLVPDGVGVPGRWPFVRFEAAPKRKQ